MNDIETAELRPAATVSGDAPLQLAIVIPTLNEAANIQPLLERMGKALAGIRWEAVFVDDDSVDGTADLIRHIGIHDQRVRVVQRIGRRGLSSAVVEGMLATAAPVLAVMDADLQHDETLLPRLFSAIAGDGCDLAVGSRYAEGGSLDGLDARREQISRLGTWLAALVMKTPLSDPMSGFFAIRREVFVDALPRLSNIGFKILVDLVASSARPLAVREIPYRFGPRFAGESKLDNRVAQEFLILFLEKLFRGHMPVRFLLFSFVGSLGLLVHLGVLGLLVGIAGQPFRMGQTLAVFIAMTFNYALNNALTYRDIRLKGTAFFRGLITFYAICLIGAVGNIGVGELIYNIDQRWVLGGLAGAAVGVVWNYAVSSVFTWRRK